MVMDNAIPRGSGGGCSSSSGNRFASFLTSKKLRSFSLFSIGVLIYLSFASDVPPSFRQLQDGAEEISFFDETDGNVSRTPSRRKKKKVAFMFLSTDGIHHDSIWEKWFLSGNSNIDNPKDFEERASIFVHATDADALRISPTLSPFFSERVIPAVPTQYYKNLLDAMVQVLLYAHSDPQNTHFVFISDSSIPLKPFDEVYAELVNDTTSRFCLRPNERAHDMWGRFPALHMPPEYHRESEMWSSLSRNHVSEIIKHLNSDLMVWQRANTVRTMAPHGPYGGAPDETFLPTLLQKVVGTQAFNSCHGTVRETNEVDSSTDNYMGCCPTFLDWPDYPRHKVQLDECVNLSASSPCLYKKLSIKDMKKLYDAGYLFVRKIDRNAILVDESGTEIPWVNHGDIIASLNSLVINTDVI